MRNKHTGTLQIMPAHIIQNLMAVPGDAIGTMKELVDNALDADASNVWVILEPNRITVQDDGHGMVPRMPEQDYEMLQLYKEEFMAGNEPDDVRDLLDDPCAFASFTWLMECIGFSSKKRLLDPTKTIRTKQGMRGIGALSINLIGDRQTWFSRPRPELANLYYGEQAVKDGKVPTSRLHPPSMQNIVANRHNYNVDDIDERFMRDPFGNIVVGGTRIEISKIRDGVSRMLTTENLAEELKKLYGKLIREGKIKIIIVDRRSDEEKVTEVEGSNYDGVLLLKATLDLKLNSRNKPPFTVEVYYDDRGSGSSPDLLRAGLAVGQITNLTEFRREDPWNSGRLSGYVEFPVLPADIEITAWDTAKTKLQNSRARDLWVQKVAREVTPQLLRRIEEIQSRARDTALEAAFAQATEAAVQAMGEVPELNGLKFVQPEPPTRPRKKTKKSPRPTSIRVVVIDENNIGVSDVGVELYRKGKFVVKRITSLGGSTSFGKARIGDHRINLILPSGSGYYSRDGKLDHSFSITEEDEGFRMVFQIITGRKMPEQEAGPTRFTLGTTTLDEGIPYSIARMSNGLLQINTEGAALKTALDSGDENLRNLLIAEYIAAGLTEWGLADYSAAKQHLVRSRTFERVASFLFARKRRRRR